MVRGCALVELGCRLILRHMVLVAAGGTMFCEKCGSEVRAGVQFCRKCGSRVDVQLAPNVEVAPVETNVAAANTLVGNRADASYFALLRKFSPVSLLLAS